MTYKKPLKAFMATTLMGFSANAEDTADGKRIGSYAIDALEAHETIETEGTDKKILVPFHAVKKAQYGIFTANAEKADPYCEGGSERELIGEANKYFASCDDFSLFIDTARNFNDYKITWEMDGSIREAVSAIIPESSDDNPPCYGFGFDFGEGYNIIVDFDVETGEMSIVAEGGRISGKFYREAK